ncbi:MAG: hypothetical protein IJH70_13155 [Oscillospiraceae bacterium]|nr:hypothetical protein [Oscillospiraceae bacterium]
MNDNQILARMLVNAFLEDYSNLTEKIKSHPQDDEVIRCGIELLKEEIQETEECSKNGSQGYPTSYPNAPQLLPQNAFTCIYGYLQK